MIKMILVFLVHGALAFATDDVSQTATKPPQTPSMPMPGFAAMGLLAPPVPMATFEARVVPANHSPALSENRLTVSAPVYRNEMNATSVSATAGDLHFSRPMTLDSTGTVVAANFYRDEIGAQYFHRLPEQRSWGVRGAVGSASDKPFDQSRDITFSVNANYTFQGSEKSTWVLMVFFGNNSLLGDYVPIPGFLYIYKTEKFTGMFGFPILSMQWRPVDPWVYTMSVFGPVITIEAAYGHFGDFQPFIAATWTRQRYMPSDRLNDDDRLTVEEKKAMIGIRTPPIVRSLTSEFQFGEDFDRSLYIGSTTFDKSGGSINLDSGIYVSASLKAAF